MSEVAVKNQPKKKFERFQGEHQIQGLFLVELQNKMQKPVNTRLTL